MREIDFSDDPHRRKHFEFFRRMDQPHTGVCAPVDITAFLRRIREQEEHFTTNVVYELTRAANAIPEFRRRIRHDRVVEHERVHPSFTVHSAASSVFSFCTVTYTPERNVFLARARREMERRQSEPSFEDEPGRDDFLFLSALPWISFTSVQHAMHLRPADSVPRIVWGKYYQRDGRTWLPVSVQAHHALVNGREVGQFFAFLEEKFQKT